MQSLQSYFYQLVYALTTNQLQIYQLQLWLDCGLLTFIAHFQEPVNTFLNAHDGTKADVDIPAPLKIS